MNTSNLFWGLFRFGVWLVTVWLSNHQVRADSTTNQTSNATNHVIASIRSGSQLEFENMLALVAEDRNRLVSSLVGIVQNTNESNFSRCAAAHYLGELRSDKSVVELAANITLKLDITKVKLVHTPVLSTQPAADALIKIGNPSIPSLVSNLRETDDSNMSETSLRVLVRIDGDTELTRLRILKALNKEQDHKATQRLQRLIDVLDRGVSEVSGKM